MIQQNTKMPHINKILEFLGNKFDIRSITIEIYISRVVNIRIPDLPFMKVRKLDIERYISLQPSCRHIKYIGANPNIPCFNLYFG
jgi:hypothetical protein